jgi:hypothetical protein
MAIDCLTIPRRFRGCSEREDRSWASPASCSGYQRLVGGPWGSHGSWVGRRCNSDFVPDSWAKLGALFRHTGSPCPHDRLRNVAQRRDPGPLRGTRSSRWCGLPPWSDGPILRTLLGPCRVNRSLPWRLSKSVGTLLPVRESLVTRGARNRTRDTLTHSQKHVESLGTQKNLGITVKTCISQIINFIPGATRPSSSAP